MAQFRYVLVDVFTDVQLEGNPLAVFTDARALAPERMARIANEMNLSETTFVLPSEGEGDVRVRIFTPRMELPFAGHPVCGTAWVIGRGVPLEIVRLECGVGVVTVELVRHDGVLHRAVMTQPRPSFEPAPDPEALVAALGLPMPDEPVEVGDNGVRTAFVAAPSLEALGAVEPDLKALRAAPGGINTVGVYVLDGDEVRFRVFAPAAGIVEDPATGSAAGPLAALLVRRGVREPGPIVVRQGVEMGRPSRIETEIGADGGVRVGGGCAVVGRGFLEL